MHPDESSARSRGLAGLRGAALLALSGAVVATACDLGHVLTGTLSYPEPTWLGQPWWSLPAFFAAFVVMTAGYLSAARRLPPSIVGRSRTRGSMDRFVLALAAFALAYGASGALDRYPTVLVVALYGTFAVRLATTYDRRFAAGVAVVLAIAGMAGEGMMSRAGLVAYRAPVVFGVPFWLGAVYAHGALALREGVRALVFRPEVDAS